MTHLVDLGTRVMNHFPSAGWPSLTCFFSVWSFGISHMDIISHRYKLYIYIYIYMYMYIFKYTHTYIYIYVYVKYSSPGVDTENVAFQPLNGRVRVYFYLDGMGMPCHAPSHACWIGSKAGASHDFPAYAGLMGFRLWPKLRRFPIWESGPSLPWWKPGIWNTVLHHVISCILTLKYPNIKHIIDITI